MKKFLFICLILSGFVMASCANDSKQNQETEIVENEEESLTCLCCPLELTDSVEAENAK